MYIQKLILIEIKNILIKILRFLNTKSSVAMHSLFSLHGSGNDKKYFARFVRSLKRKGNVNYILYTRITNFLCCVNAIHWKDEVKWAVYEMEQSRESWCTEFTVIYETP